MQKIKSIHFTKEATFIGFVESYVLRDVKDPLNDKTAGKGKEMDLPRHADFEYAMQRLKPFLLLGTELLAPNDENGNHLQRSHFTDSFADSDAQYEGLEVTGILIQGKHAADGVQIFGTKTTSNEDVVKLKTPPMPLKAIEGVKPFEFIGILDEFVDRVLSEGDLYHQRKKHGAGLQVDLPLQHPVVNTENKLKKAQDFLVVQE